MTDTDLADAVSVQEEAAII